MKQKIFLAMMAAMLVGISFGSTPAYSADKEKVYGRELMTEQERIEERQKMRNMNDAEREQYRIEKHEQMKERAKEQGKEIPDAVGERGKGLGQGQGMGQGRGMGQGQGNGQGRGMGGGQGRSR
ncbi:MAG: hypothetical protein COW19_03125 [Zetaproteobacteria bacterium CG12_big_fil_rev_8_21_14_0_65_55_1124]|nr:MAG: hypothetical protein AUJ58_09440 [Zetaproteobacteria bacterium CG1_02_55_237]PIS19386.1 MAG: hypothetical protein COT53_06115 [Zetaproteobacteria bacterium CG08_land_8_20_14_0_20_55_17]PIW43431.1 MAG: hypothetical protein COW19_03125 [Zetaproteobacteria bacterium CG12_big_fil_rev_8_21_14_0_65_55_1124]PIY53627.1 MAG: hypothetical protein COZ01_03260 [Zetaproteobacteria bacterium CG_4_10_14_0_8_um_filter_55_43]PIZ37287.1 MAG: hypothetical protein COY36_09845 [Zetaproteobacteria bacterium 